ncbi:hypothetical protein HK100_001617 [Physocladia obscura]|uniref:Uncharacterized protein n=1 Tax=Physocladia obscura TaxID=109957 RepID=A0AAD5XER6_9FUNG|nr:hypothetical protein HK100_001617 [Physocladia obscura]
MDMNDSNVRQLGSITSANLDSATHSKYGITFELKFEEGGYLSAKTTDFYGVVRTAQILM